MKFSILIVFSLEVTKSAITGAIRKVMQKQKKKKNHKNTTIILLG